eukprot:247481_1
MSKAEISRGTTRGTLVSFLELPPINLFDQKVSRYYIEYWSIDAHEKLQLVSGCVAIPDIKNITQPLNLLVYNHGTATKGTFIPSNPNDPYGHAYASFFSGLHKYITIMTDYLGYGVSSHLPHPYCMPKTLGYNAMDALLCSLQLFNKLNINKTSLINTKDIFIGGYSEGGLTTMGLLRILESEPYNKQFNVAACTPGAAPFTNNAKFTLENPGNHTHVYNAFYFLSIQRIFSVFNSLNDIFNEKYVNVKAIENDLFNGNYHYNEISERLPKDPKQLLNERYVNGVLNGTLITDKLYKKFIKKVIELNTFVRNYKFKSKIYYIAAGNDLETPFHINYKFIEKNKERMYPNIEVINVGNMLDHGNEGKFLALNMQVYCFNKSRDKINSKYKSKL